MALTTRHLAMFSIILFANVEFGCFFCVLHLPSLETQGPEYLLRLQEGKFDDPNRLFHSMTESWVSTLNNMTDVKELIPEFYDTSGSDVGQFLENRDLLQLGVRQEGVVVNNVVLPPWARCFVTDPAILFSSSHYTCLT